MNTLNPFNYHGLTGYVAQTNRPPIGGVLLLPMITGIGSRVREFAHDFTQIGLTTVCWDPFHGPNSDTHPIETLQQCRDKIADETALEEQRQLIDYMEHSLRIRQFAVIGYCMGGRYALLLANSDHRISTIIAYHPTIMPEPPQNHTIDAISAAQATRADAMVHYAGQDHLVPKDTLVKLQNALQARNEGITSIHYYPDASHGFSDSAHHGNKHNRIAYQVAQRLTLSFFQVMFGENQSPITSESN